jgi:hypothetical protein
MELEIIRSEAIVAYFKALFWHFSGGTEENGKPQSGLAGLRTNIL